MRSWMQRASLGVGEPVYRSQEAGAEAASFPARAWPLSSDPVASAQTQSERTGGQAPRRLEGDTERARGLLMATGRLHGTRAPLGLGDPRVGQRPSMEGTPRGLLHPLPSLYTECPAFSRDSEAHLFAASPFARDAQSPRRHDSARVEAIYLNPHCCSGAVRPGDQGQAPLPTQTEGSAGGAGSVAGSREAAGARLAQNLAERPLRAFASLCGKEGGGRSGPRCRSLGSGCQPPRAPWRHKAAVSRSSHEGAELKINTAPVFGSHILPPGARRRRV